MSNENELPVVAYRLSSGGLSYYKPPSVFPCDDLVLLSDAQRIRDERDRLRERIEALQADNDRLKAEREEIFSAVRWAPSSAYWSEELNRLLGPDARKGINVLDRRIVELQAEVERLTPYVEAFRREERRADIASVALYGAKAELAQAQSALAAQQGGEANEQEALEDAAKQDDLPGGRR